MQYHQPLRPPERGGQPALRYAGGTVHTSAIKLERIVSEFNARHVECLNNLICLYVMQLPIWARGQDFGPT